MAVTYKPPVQPPASMTKEELVGIRNQFGMNQSEFAIVIGRSTRMVAGYETGENPVPGTVALAVRLLEQFHREV